MDVKLSRMVDKILGQTKTFSYFSFNDSILQEPAMIILKFKCFLHKKDFTARNLVPRAFPSKNGKSPGDEVARHGGWL